MHFVRWVIVTVCASGCAGELTPEVSYDTVTGTTSGAGGSTMAAGGAGGGPGGVDPCIVNTPALKACQNVGCHIGPPLSAELDLSVASVTTRAKLLLDKPNAGTMGVQTLGDANGCPPGSFKLIDSANPTSSLIYAKLRAQGETPTNPCGGWMPVIGAFTADNKACVLKWIQSVIALK